jgi:hypothetical protein
MKKMKIGQTFKIDTDRVSQYKGERIVDNVRILVVPKKTDKKVLVYSPKLRSDVLVYKSDLKVIYSKEWKLTDPDSNQYGRQLTDMLFEFKEDGKDETGIDLSAFKNKEIESVINSYGYTLYRKSNILTPKKGLENIFDLYGKDANWIIAECIFETDVQPDFN